MNDTDRQHLRRAVDLAEVGMALNNDPFGSVLVSAEGKVLFEGHNHTANGDQTRHPEFDIARWAAENLTPQQRASATVYTSGEHCPMCAAAHGWVGLGRIVYAGSIGQLTGWLAEVGVPPSPVRALSITDILTNGWVEGPDPTFAPRLRDLHHRRAAALGYVVRSA
jgi:tRNA(Arg) A34 adenosine deaminase TadA